LPSGSTNVVTRTPGGCVLGVTTVAPRPVNRLVSSSCWSGQQDRTESVLDRLGNVGGRMEHQPRAARLVGGIDRHVPGESARAERAAEDVPPEFRHGCGIRGIEVQGCEAEGGGCGHDSIPFEVFVRGTSSLDQASQ
jgi:hypothetical protein